MDPNETMSVPEYNECSSMKDLLHIPLRFLGIDDGITMKTIGMIMELCRFGKMGICNPNELTKVVKTRILKDVTHMEGEIPVTQDEEQKISIYLFGLPARFGSPIDLVAIRTSNTDAPDLLQCCFMASDAIYAPDAGFDVSAAPIDQDDLLYLFEKNVFGHMQTLCDMFNALLDGNYSFTYGAMSPYETDSECEDFTDEEAMIVESTTSHPGLFPEYWADIYAKMQASQVESERPAEE